MIKKSIVIHKPRVPAPVQQQNSQAWNDWLVSRDSSSPRVMRKEEFEEWLSTHAFNQIGMLVTFVKKDTPVTALHQVHMLVDIAKEWQKIPQWDPYSNKPKCFKFVQIKDDDPWLRWDTDTGYRFLTEEEINNFIKPNHDKVQHCRATYAGPKAPDPV